MPATPTLGQLLRNSAARAMQDAQFAIPGTVVAYDPLTNTASVYPGVMDVIPDEENPDELLNVELPAVQNVRVVWPKARGIDLTPPVSAPGLLPGDPVLLICSDRDISGWAQTGKQSPPDDTRYHDWSCGAFAIPGALPDVTTFTPPTDAAALASKLDMLILILKSWVVTPADGGSALKAAVLAAFPNITGTFPPSASVGVTTGSNILKVSS